MSKAPFLLAPVALAAGLALAQTGARSNPHWLYLDGFRMTLNN